MRICPRRLTTRASVALFLVAAGLLPIHQATAYAQDATLVATVSARTKVLDLGVSNSGTPNVWDTGSYDDSAWGHAVPASSDTVSCIRPTLGDLGKLPLFWGPTTNHYYAFRLTIIVPNAQSYEGSAVDYANNDGTNTVSFNGTALSNPYGGPWHSGLHALSIKSLVVPGLNVLGIVEGPSTPGCKGAAGARITIHVQGAKGPLPASSPTPIIAPLVSLASPAENAIVTGTSLPLSWNPVSNAAVYLVHVWLVKADAGQTITKHSTATIARTVVGNRASMPTAGMPKGSYRWTVAAINAKGTLIADWGAIRTLQVE